MGRFNRHMTAPARSLSCFLISITLIARVAYAQQETDQHSTLQPAAERPQSPSSGDELPLLIKQRDVLRAQIEQLVREHKFAEAEARSKDFILLEQKLNGQDSLPAVNALSALADLYLSQGDCKSALPLTRQALQIVQKQLDSSAAVQSERQQISLENQFRRQLDSFLSAARSAGLEPDEIYQPVLAWKGYSFIRQRLLRQARHTMADNSAVVEMFNDIQAKARALAAAYNACQERKQPVAGNKRIFELSQSLETAERRLAGMDHDLAATSAEKECSPASIQESLPRDTGLIDVLEYMRFNKANAEQRESTQRCVIAFVVRPNRPIAIVDLGPAEPIFQTVSDWRDAQLPRDPTPDNAALPKKELTLAEKALRVQRTGDALRQLVWDKLAPYLDGCKTVLVSPDGALASISWAAFPGKEPGEFLIEDVAIAVIPVPQTLPGLLETRINAIGLPAQLPSLLVVGNVDLYGDPGHPEIHVTPQIPQLSDHVLDKFGSLPMSKAQVLAIRDRFQGTYPQGSVTVLTGNQATEQTIRDFAPRSTYIHFATHGYYYPPPVEDTHSAKPAAVSSSDQGSPTSELSKLPPELFCGINLVGTYRYVQPGKDDGRLTALEVKTMDLESVELVTLCACQTAMGVSVEGEGIFSLQRAFQEAGARSTITTLWNIPVVTSDPLMVDFYDNLWVKKMSRLEALRQAQIKMLRTGAIYIAKVRGKPPPGSNVRLPPVFWAGFVLAGDWR